MAKCVVTLCKSTNRELFCAPDDKKKLKKWQQILKIKDLDEFLICDLHFNEKYIKYEKYLTQDAFPTLLICDEDYKSSSDDCQSCMKKFEFNDAKICVSETFKKLFTDKTAYEIKLDSFVCDECHDKFMKFESFISKIIERQEIKKTHYIKNEPIDITDDNNITEKDLIEEIVTYPQLTSEDDSCEKSQITSVSIHSVQDIPEQHAKQQIASSTSHPKEETNSRKVSTEHSQHKFEKFQDYLIPLRNEPEKNNIEEESAENTPMAIIPNHLEIIPKKSSNFRRARSQTIYIEKYEKVDKDMNNSILHDHGFMADAVGEKRRNSVASTSQTPSIKRPRKTNLPTKCEICQIPFTNIVTLKLHQENEHRLDITSKQKTENIFKCTGCNESFTSYYFLRKHKDSCDFSLTYKCSQQYCRYRCATISCLQNHMLEVHFNQTLCKICKVNFETTETLKAHEMKEHTHSKRERPRKQKLVVKPDIKIRKVKFNQSTSEESESKSYQAHFVKEMLPN